MFLLPIERNLGTSTPQKLAVKLGDPALQTTQESIFPMYDLIPSNWILTFHYAPQPWCPTYLAVH